MYKFYRQLNNGKWKYTESFNSTLDPNYHELINYCNQKDIKWKLINSLNEIKFHN